MPNRLATEPSPYLLQHKDNPVDWFPWGDEAFARARREDKPIFLSIGYSTCHWCHVMEHESFEHPQVAEVLNRDFVSIKVDREERPDVDRVYMTFIQATTGSGGWPMSVWLTPSLEPFYGGTYFPPEARWGKPGFVQILEEIARVWREERPKVIGSAATIVERLKTAGRDPRSGPGSSPRAIPGVEALVKTAQEFAGMFDARRGGFGDAPKFPRPSELLFLLREHYRTGEAVPRDIVLLTLRAMALGGMRDHLGGGFHRYSVDGNWRVPHFEKMLYDQAQLVLAYIEAAQVSGDRFYADVARDTLEYVRRDMTDADGGFYSAEDADSLDEDSGHKKEGAFYVWKDSEIGEALGEDADVFRECYGVMPNGNAPFDPQHEFTGRNLLYTARPLDSVAKEMGQTPGETQSALDRARRLLFEVRNRRPRPHLDDKVLTAWNGLMIASFARAARTFAGKVGSGYVADAQRAAAFIRARLWNAGTRTLLRRYRQGEAGVEAYAEDYAGLVFGLIELFQADGDPAWLEWAIDLQRRQDELFWDEASGGWFGTSGTDPSVLLRMKEDYDGAEPAASSVSALNLLMLAHLTGDAAHATKAERTLAAFASRLEQMGRAMPMMLTALETYHLGVPQILIAGPGEAALPLVEEVQRHYLPNAIVLRAGADHGDALARVLPWTAPMLRRRDPAAYVCRDFACERPVDSAAELRGLIDSLRGH